MKHSAILKILALLLLFGALHIPLPVLAEATDAPSTVNGGIELPSPPSVSARCAVLYCPEADTVLYERNGEVRCGMASTTKILTALIAIEYLSLSMPISIPKEACGIEGSSLYLQAGEILTVEQLLHGVLLRSANDAASALAIACDGSVEAFAEHMNRRAAELGAIDSHFVNPHGLDDPAHYTTALDLSKLTRAAMENETFRSIVCQKTYTIPSDGEIYRVLQNHNKLLWRYPDAIGVKTGFTKKCGRCLVSAAERDGVELYAVTLDAPSDWSDHKALLDYGFSLMENKKLAEAGDLLFSAPVAGGKTDQVYLTNNEEMRAVLRRDAPCLTLRYEYNRPLTAPIRKGEVLGTVYLMEGDKVRASSSLVAQRAVDPALGRRSLLSHLTKLFHK